jgi:carboxypeptidase Taq
MDSTYLELKERLAKIHDLGQVEGLLGWDQQTKMPPNASDVRAAQIATVVGIQHEMFASDETGRLLDQLDSFANAQDPASDEARLIRVTQRDWERQRRVPNELASELAQASGEGYAAWHTARANSDFPSFLPYLERMIDLKRRYVECFPEVSEPWDALFEDYESGMTAAEVKTVFGRVQERLTPLMKLVAANPHAVDDSPLRGFFPADLQEKLSRRLLAHWGFNDEGWRLDPTAHPFASAAATTDVRLTTRYDEAYLGTSLFGSLHECGHGMYEAGVSPTLERSPLCHGVSLGLHESQSRMWENLVGRSRAYWKFAYPTLIEEFPEQFKGLDEEAVYRAANKIAPSFIRVEADEASYTLHIIIRFELELAIFRGELQAAELENAWNAKYKEYLGIEVPDAATGVLQDVHWSLGLMGYFPCYALGNVLSCQIWDRMQTDLGDLDAKVGAGEFAPLQDWLREHLWRHGRKFSPKETILLAAGAPLNPEPYLAYLTEKVTGLYGS